MRIKKRKSKYKAGEYLMQSDITGRVDYRSNMRKMWNGLWCHKDEYEIRNPQDHIKVPKDTSAVPEARPRRTADYTTVTPDDL